MEDFPIMRWVLSDVHIVIEGKESNNNPLLVVNGSTSMVRTRSEGTSKLLEQVAQSCVTHHCQKQVVMIGNFMLCVV